MRRLVVAAALPVVCACAQVFPLKPAEGAARIEFVSPSAFRLVRTWSGAAAPQAASPEEPVAKMEEAGGRLRFTTRYLTVDVDQDGGRVDVRSERGPLTAMTIRREGIEASAAAGERFYGLGSRRTAQLDLRGSRVQAARPFLLSSAGYGVWAPRCLACPFDLGAEKTDRWSVRTPGERMELYFYYGPTAKEIWEEHLEAAREGDTFDSTDLAIRLRRVNAAAGSWESLREEVYRLQHESMSAMLTPSLDLSPYQAAGGELLARAVQLAAFIPRVRATPGAEAALDEMASLRERLKLYMEAYGYETRGRGAPLIHALAAHFARDPEAARRNEAFMVGDELLLAPVLRPGGTVTVYLPQGVWTELHTNERYQGRREISVRARPGEVPVFARNGSIVPLAAADGVVELHYYPRLGGEFFLYEEDIEDFTQVHAAPADEFMRLEIESKKDRTFEWVVHHTPACRRVAIGEREFVRVKSAEKLAPDAWFYDAAAQSLHVRVRASANGDEIVNIAF